MRGGEEAKEVTKANLSASLPLILPLPLKTWIRRQISDFKVTFNTFVVPLYQLSTSFDSMSMPGSSYGGKCIDVRFVVKSAAVWQEAATAVGFQLRERQGCHQPTVNPMSIVWFNLRI